MQDTGLLLCLMLLIGSWISACTENKEDETPKENPTEIVTPQNNPKEALVIDYNF